MHVSKLPRSYGNNIFPLFFFFFFFFSSLVSFQPHGFGAKRRISAFKGRKINQAPRMDYIPRQEFLSIGDVENLANIFPQKIVECIQEKIKFSKNFPIFCQNHNTFFQAKCCWKLFKLLQQGCTTLAPPPLQASVFFKLFSRLLKWLNPARQSV